MKVLVATDGSRAGDSAVRFAAGLAASCRGGRLLAVTVGGIPAGRFRRGARLRYGLPSAMEERDRLWAEKTLDRARRDGRRLGASVRCAYVGTRQLEPIARTIARAAEREGADLVVVGGGGGTQLARWALGSIAHRLVHVARRPIAVVRAGARMKPRPVRILVATDGSKPSLEAVRFGARLTAAMPRARLVVLTISTLASDVVLTGAGLVRAVGILPELGRAERKAAERILRAAARETRRLGTRVRQVYRNPRHAVSAAEAIVREAAVQAADLIVLGNTGRTAVNDLLLGSVAQRVLGLSRRPVALVRSRSRGKS
jgi:nucleotide-binding universal stress UspA family protein